MLFRYSYALQKSPANLRGKMVINLLLIFYAGFPVLDQTQRGDGEGHFKSKS